MPYILDQTPRNRRGRIYSCCRYKVIYYTLPIFGMKVRSNAQFKGLHVSIILQKSNLPFTQLCAYVSWVIGLNYSIIWEMNFIIIHSLKAYMQLLFFKNNLPFTQLCACVSWVIITQLYKRNGLRNNSRLWKQQKRGKYFISVLKERRNIPVASAHFRCSAFAAFRSLNTFCSN